MGMPAIAVAHDDWARLSPATALAFTARVVNSSLQIDDVLRTVVKLSCDVLLASRATILLLDDAQCLVPAASEGRIDDPDALARFRQMAPVRVTQIPRALELLSTPQAVVIPDVSASPLIPVDWREGFGLKSLLLAPIVTHGEVLGALVVDYAEQREGFTNNEILTIEGIAACTSTALRNARQHDEVVRRACSLDESLNITAQLNAATTVRAVCDVALEGLLRLLDGHAASLHLVDGEHLVTLAAWGPGHPEPGSYDLPIAVDRAAGWLAGTTEDVTAALRRLGPFRYLPASRSTVLLPLTDPPPPGFAVVSCRREPSPEVWRVARSVAGQVMLALDRARLTEETHRRMENLETSYRLANELAAAADLDAVVAQLAKPIRTATGAEVIDILLAPGTGSERFSGRPLGTHLTGLMGACLQSPPERPFEDEGLLVVPMLLDTELIGLVRVRRRGGRIGPSEEGFLLAVASAVASLVTRAGLSAQIGAAQRELAVVQERERIARDLHDTLGQSLFALGLQLAECDSTLKEPGARGYIEQARALNDAASLQLRQAIHALAFLRTGRKSLRASLRELARETTPGLNVLVSTTGRCVPLAPDKAEAVIRVAREALVNVEKHARASDVAIALRYSDSDFQLVITDNGTGLAHRSGPTGGGLHFGLRCMQRRLQEVEGSLAFENIAPHGLRLTATVPM
jgi:signal transduction histidine kinase